MSDGLLLLFGGLEVVGLVALLGIGRRNVRRRREGLGRPPRAQRIATALLGLAVLIGGPTLVVVAVSGRVNRAEHLREQLAETGKPANAQIHLIEETGTLINREPEIRVYLTVRPEGEEPFDAESVWVFSTQDVQRYHAGAEVHVLYAPDDHGKVVVTGLAAGR